jgi:hypothetical protein
LQDLGLPVAHPLPESQPHQAGDNGDRPSVILVQFGKPGKQNESGHPDHDE